MSLIVQAIVKGAGSAFFMPQGSELSSLAPSGFSQEGHGLLRAFQNSGASASGEHAWWKLFRADRIIRLEVLAGTF